MAYHETKFLTILTSRKKMDPFLEKNEIFFGKIMNFFGKDYEFFWKKLRIFFGKKWILFWKKIVNFFYPPIITSAQFVLIISTLVNKSLDILSCSGFYYGLQRSVSINCSSTSK
jgi:hypothetical protein